MTERWAWVVVLAHAVLGCGSNGAADFAEPAAAPAVILEGDYRLASDAELEQLAGATEVRGNVEIDGASVTTLSALSSVGLITGDLRITNTPCAGVCNGNVCE
jgi:hypothetical protein